MTKTLVQELREANERGLAPPQNWTHRAIDEIEWLTRECVAKDKRINHLKELRDDNQELQDEIERLRAIVGRMLPYVQRWESADAAELEAQTSIEDEAERVLYRSPEPSKQLVRIPTSEREAELMTKLGMQWLEQHAPHRLKSLAGRNEDLAASGNDFKPKDHP